MKYWNKVEKVNNYYIYFFSGKINIGHQIQWKLSEDTNGQIFGTVVEIDSDKVKIKWDIDVITTCKTGKNDQYDLLLLDSSECESN